MDVAGDDDSLEEQSVGSVGYTEFHSNTQSIASLQVQLRRRNGLKG